MALRRSKYSMHHAWLTGASIGTLTPIFLQEVTPGDTWSGVSSGILRLDPLDRPAFVSLKAYFHFFFVPYRILWDEFEDVITGASSASWPTVAQTVGAWPTSIAKDYGIGEPPGGGLTINALPIRAYNSVWNNFFRDQSEQAEVSLDNLNVLGCNVSATDYYGGFRSEIQQGSEETVDSSGATIGVTEIRDAFHRQKFRERRSQFGERYTDYLAAMGVRAPDSRLDRPEHVARHKCTLGIGEVMATATSASENTGDYRGHGIAGCRIPFRKKNFVEHGVLLGVMVLKSRHQVANRMDKMFLVNDKDDLFQQELARDTQVVIDNKEWNAKNTAGNWGYTRRDQWLRTARDTIAGEMINGSKDAWHGAKDFGSTPPTYVQALAVDKLLDLFQDQTGTSVQVYSYFDHRIGKRSLVPAERRLA